MVACQTPGCPSSLQQVSVCVRPACSSWQKGDWWWCYTPPHAVFTLSLNCSVRIRWIMCKFPSHTQISGECKCVIYHTELRSCGGAAQKSGSSWWNCGIRNVKGLFWVTEGGEFTTQALEIGGNLLPSSLFHRGVIQSCCQLPHPRSGCSESRLMNVPVRISAFLSIMFTLTHCGSGGNWLCSLCVCVCVGFNSCLGNL